MGVPSVQTVERHHAPQEVPVMCSKISLPFLVWMWLMFEWVWADMIVAYLYCESSSSTSS